MHPMSTLTTYSSSAKNFTKNIANLNKWQLYDPGAKEFASELAQSLQCICCLCAFSRVIIDPDACLLSQHLIQQVENTFINPYVRISSYYEPYHKLIRKIIRTIGPKYHISVHTKNNIENDIEIIHNKNTLAYAIREELGMKRVNAKIENTIEYELGINKKIEFALYPKTTITSLRLNIPESINRKPLLNNLSNTFTKVLI